MLDIPREDVVFALDAIQTLFRSLNPYTMMGGDADVMDQIKDERIRTMLQEGLLKEAMKN